MTYELREVREGDIPFLAANLRSSDVRELIATYGHTRFEEGLSASVQYSTEASIGAPIGGNPVALWGVCPYNRRSSLIWAVGTAEVAQWTIPFLRTSRRVIKAWFEESPEIDFFFNFTHADNTLHHKWLRWCGADMLPAMPHGPMGELFHPFQIRRTKYV